MTFTAKEEKILKLRVAEMKARTELNNANQIMGDLIRVEFTIIDQRIRAEHKPIYEPLQTDAKTAQENLIKEFE